MIASSVIIFGSGPRLRSICAALVRDCTVEVHALPVESLETVARRSIGYRTQVVFLDARVAVEIESFVAFLEDPRELVVASAIGWGGEPSSQPAALTTRKPVDPASLQSWFALAKPFHAPTFTDGRPFLRCWRSA